MSHALSGTEMPVKQSTQTQTSTVGRSYTSFILPRHTGQLGIASHTSGVVSVICAVESKPLAISAD